MKLSPEVEQKIGQASRVIESALMSFDSPVLMWTAGKDSTLLLWLIREVCRENQWDLPPATVIDHGLHFDETWTLLNSIAAGWDVELRIATNPDLAKGVLRPGFECDVKKLDRQNQVGLAKLGFAGKSIRCSLDSLEGNHLLKTLPLQDTIREHGYDAVFVGIRRDEDSARSQEEYLSQREAPDHVRIHPILDFGERDVWDVTLNQQLPYHPLYKAGYRSLDGALDSRPIDRIPAWEQDLAATDERAGRAQDKEEIMDRLRSLGYF